MINKRWNEEANDWITREENKKANKHAYIKERGKQIALAKKFTRTGTGTERKKNKLNQTKLIGINRW